MMSGDFRPFRYPNIQFSVQNQLGDGHSISSTKSRRGKRALHEKLRQMRKAKSEKQNPNK